MMLPHCTTLALQQEGWLLRVTLNRPEQRNAMSLQMVEELAALFEALQYADDIRTLLLRGAGGHFCAGGDVRDMAGLRQQLAADPQAAVRFNRAFGRMLQLADRTPQVLVAVLEGAVLGGGFGLACVSDVALARADAQFGLPETGLGLIPAQIAPFVLQRIGLTQARRLALLGLRINGAQAQALGLVHEVFADNDALEAAVAQTLDQIARCAPAASRRSKQLLHAAAAAELDAVLDQAADWFSEAVQGREAAEGAAAFIGKRQPAWTELAWTQGEGQ